MNLEMFLGLGGILVMLLLILFAGMSPGLAMLLVGTIGSMILMPEFSLEALLAGPTGAEVWSVFSNYGFTVIPLFVMLGSLLPPN